MSTLELETVEAGLPTDFLKEGWPAPKQLDVQKSASDPVHTMEISTLQMFAYKPAARDSAAEGSYKSSNPNIQHKS